MSAQASLPFTDSIQQRFESYNAAHPEVYAHLLRLALDLRGRGWQRYSIRTLWEAMRWNFDVKKDEAMAFRLNDHFPSRYARLLMEDHAELAGFFELRELKGDRR